jgi:hypothetical protein
MTRKLTLAADLLYRLSEIAYRAARAAETLTEEKTR